MIALLSSLLAVLVSPFRSKSSLLAENAMFRHQVVVLRRKVKGRILGSLVVIRPETLIRWHRAGFRVYWRWKLRWQGGGLGLPM